MLPLAATGEMIALAVTPATRSAALPDVPTIAEAGVPGYAWVSWFAMLAPAHTPPAIVNTFNSEIVRIIQLPDVKKRWETLGAEAMPLTPNSSTNTLPSSPNWWPSWSRPPTSKSSNPGRVISLMRVKIFPWLGQQFIELSWDGNGEGTVEDETRDLFARFAERLGQYGLTLDHVARTRMFVRDMDGWYAGVHERAVILSGKARSVSSSHIWPDRSAARRGSRSICSRCFRRPSPRKRCSRNTTRPPSCCGG